MFERYTFVVIALVVYVYLLTKKRKVDVFTVAGIFSFLVFIPAFVGTVFGPPGYPVRIVEPELYISFSTYYLVFFVFVLWNDYYTGRYDKTRPILVSALANQRAYLVCISLLFWLSVSLLLIRFGDIVFSGSKRNFVDTVGYEFLLFKTSSSLVILAGLLAPGKKFKLYVVIVTLVTFAVGTRGPAAIAFVAFIVLKGAEHRRMSVLKERPISFVVVTTCSVLFATLIKPAYALFRLGGASALQERFFNESLWDRAMRGAEFMRTQYSFNEMVLRGFETNGDHVLKAPLSVLPIPRSWYTTSSGEFNSLYQTVLFPERVGGMAYNPLAEVYVAFGYVGIWVLAIVTFLSLLLINIGLYKVRRAFILYIMAIIAAILSFYFFRSSTGVMFGLMRNYLYLSVLCGGVVGFLSYVTRLKDGLIAADKERHVYG